MIKDNVKLIGRSCPRLFEEDKKPKCFRITLILTLFEENELAFHLQVQEESGIHREQPVIKKPFGLSITSQKLQFTIPREARKLKLCSCNVLYKSRTRQQKVKWMLLFAVGYCPLPERCKQEAMELLSPSDLPTLSKSACHDLHGPRSLVSDASYVTNSPMCLLGPKSSESMRRIPLPAVSVERSRVLPTARGEGTSGTLRKVLDQGPWTRL